MKKIYALLFISFIISRPVDILGQCGSGRYFDKVFTGRTRTTLDFGGWKKNIGTGKTHLLLDLYEPKNDDEPLRPLVIMVHGGAFIDFPIIDRQSPEVVPVIEDLVLRGYVVASPDYRLVKNIFNLFNADVMVKEVIVSVLDIRDAICFFADSYYNGNPYRIDIDRIFIGGTSAGAIAVLHGLFLDRVDELKPEFQGAVRFVERLDSINIQSVLDNKYCGANVRGLISISGALIDSSLIKPRDMAVLFSHGTDDKIVPVNIDHPLNIPTLPLMYGPQVLAPRLAATGTRVEYDEWVGEGHVAYLDWDHLLDNLPELAVHQSILDSTTNHIARFCQELMGCPTRVRDNVSATLEIYPNPASGAVTLEIPAGLQNYLSLRIYNGMGQLVYSQILENNIAKYKVESLPAGPLFLLLADNRKTFTARLLVH